jgi:primary-amine oxidase
MHPLAALSEHEIKAVAGLTKGLYSPATEIHFKVITLQEPPKDQVLSYLEAEHATGDALVQLKAIDRKAWVNYYIKNTVCQIQVLISN